MTVTIGLIFSQNTLVAVGPPWHNCSGNIASLGHNLSSDSSCNFTATGDITNTNPLLQPLGNYGGTTLTYAMLPDSPAIDAGENDGCPAKDQRGTARPLDGNGDGQAICDIGAYEYVYDPQEADLLITIAGPAAPVPVGQPLTYTLVVTNYGPLTATDIRLTDTLPLSLTYVLATSAYGNCDLQSGQIVGCTFGDLPRRTAVTATLVVTSTQVGTWVNQASAGSGTPDSNVFDNHASTVTIISTMRTITVTSTADGIDADPYDNLCLTANRDCTLRAAIMEANAQSGLDRIILPAGVYTLTIPGQDEDAAATGDLDIADDLEIQGVSAEETIIDGGGLDRIFHILRPVRVDFSGVTVRHGHTPIILDQPNGGGILNEGGTLNLLGVTLRENTLGSLTNRNGTVTMTGTLVTANEAGGPDNLSGTMIIDHSAIISNTGVITALNSPVNSIYGGGLFNRTGTVTVTHSTIAWNLISVNGQRTQAYGGGIYNDHGTVAIYSSSISHNSAFCVVTPRGGGIYNTAGVITVVDSTISDNLVGGYGEGGGIYTSEGGVTVDNTTISGNKAYSGGAAIYQRDAVVTVTNSSIIGNKHEYLQGDAIIESYPGPLYLRNTIVANMAPRGNCRVGILSLGYNLSDDFSCPFTSPGDVNGIDPLVGPLQDNGGGTLSHILLHGSPAIDTGDNSNCPATDQRGVSRPLDGNRDGIATCDIGAVEVLCPQPVLIYWRDPDPQVIADHDLNHNGKVDVGDLMLELQQGSQMCR
ncbi:MAG: DUF11 domain-containing protein [Chloroflexi bacterium]|nr:DUF11 domain-containing protein [Chloroflexota bacterium]